MNEGKGNVGSPDEESAYRDGMLTAQIGALAATIARIDLSLREHQEKEEKLWDRFERSLEGLRTSISELQLWRAKILGIISVVSAGVGFAIQWIYQMSGKVK